MTSFAIVTADYLKEYCGKNKFGKPIFKEREIPHNGKRYKHFSYAVGIASELIDRGYSVKVIETIL